jgi:hypothetical protein
VDADTGKIRTLLPIGEGGEFRISPDGQRIALVSPTIISVVDRVGQNRLDLLPYDQVNTFSEYRYYAEPTWSQDSSFLRVAIPPADPLGKPLQPTDLWHITVDGTLAYQLGSLDAVPFLLAKVVYSPDLNNLIFFQEVGAPSDNTFELVLARYDGSGVWSYLKDKLLQFLSWSPDSQNFAYTIGLEKEAWLGSLDETPVQITESPKNILEVRWIDDSQIIYLKENVSTFDLVYRRIETGEEAIIDQISGTYPSYQFALLP